MSATPEAKTPQANKVVRRAKLTRLQLRRKKALLEAGVSIAAVAREAGVTRTTAWCVLHDRTRSRRVEEIFARVIGEPVEKLFPAA
jgi:lambda repressor-like predicted transcriptional regulator